MPVPAPDWERLAAQLTTFAWRNTRRRSWELAQEIAQQAIAEHFDRPEAWDPSKKTLLRHLGHEVLRIARNEMRRMRTTFEIAMDYDDLVEHEVPTGEPSPPEQLDHRRYARAFDERLGVRLAKDDVASTVLALMREGIETPAAQARASGLSIDALRGARRRVFYQGEQVAKELSRELDHEETSP